MRVQAGNRHQGIVLLSIIVALLVLALAFVAWNRHQSLALPQNAPLHQQN